MPPVNTRASSTEEALSDVNKYLRIIDAHLRRYRIILDKLTALETKKSAQAIEDRQSLVISRKDCKEQYIQAKQTARGLISLIASKDAQLASIKERELKELQETFRDLDREFKSLAAAAERSELLAGSVRSRSSSSGVGGGGGGGGGGGEIEMGRTPSAPTMQGKNNDQLLKEAISIHSETTAKLKEGLATVITTQAVGTETANQLQADREKVSRIGGTLDEIQAELVVSRKLIVNFAKRAMTDKVIIALTTLIVLATVGIIIYATVKPDQKIFNVPDVVKPPTHLP